MDYLIDTAFMTGIVMALSELSKQVGFPRKFVPLLSLAFGIASGVVYIYPQDIKLGIISGLIVGLSASGLYSGAKNISQAIVHNEKP